jgi:hypothetical protein
MECLFSKRLRQIWIFHYHTWSPGSVPGSGFWMVFRFDRCTSCCMWGKLTGIIHCFRIYFCYAHALLSEVFLWCYLCQRWLWCSPEVVDCNKKLLCLTVNLYFIYYFENTAESPALKIWHIRLACRITKSTNTLGVCNTYCFSTATIVARTRLNATLYVHCMYCLILRMCTNHCSS